jgi:hypothetical protein
LKGIDKGLRMLSLAANLDDPESVKEAIAAKNVSNQKT